METTLIAPFQRLSRDVVLYGLGSAALRLINFIFLPILTRIFSPAEYGTLETITSLIGIAGLIAELGLYSAAQRSFYDCAPDDRRGRILIISTGFWILLGWSVVLTLSLAGFANSNVAVWPLQELKKSIVLLALFTMPFPLLSVYLQETFRLEHRPVTYSIISVIFAVLNFICVIWFVVFLRKGVYGNFLGLFISGLTAFAISLMAAKNLIRFRFSVKKAQEMFSYGLPLVPTAAAIWILQLVDRFFLLHYSSLEEIGLYSVGVRLSNVLGLLVYSFAAAWSPFVLDLANRDPASERNLRPKVLIYLAAILGFGVVCLTVFSRDFFLLVTDPKFESSYKVVGLLAGSVAFIGLNSVVMTGISLARKTYYFAQYTIIAALINIGLNFILIPVWGMIGAALATLLSYAVLTILYWWRAQKLSPAPYDVPRLIFILVSTGVLAVVGTLVRLPLGWDTSFRLALILLYPAILIGLNIVPRSSFRTIWALVMQPHFVR